MKNKRTITKIISTTNRNIKLKPTPQRAPNQPESWSLIKEYLVIASKTKREMQRPTNWWKKEKDNPEITMTRAEITKTYKSFLSFAPVPTTMDMAVYRATVIAMVFTTKLRL